MNEEERGNWYLITGAVIGIILGFLYTRVIQPIEYVDTSPSSLSETYQSKYRTLIAAAYVYNNDLLRAKARLDLLGDEDIYRTVAEQAQRTLAEGGSTDEAQALGVLALALGREAPLPESTPTPSE